MNTTSNTSKPADRDKKVPQKHKNTRNDSSKPKNVKPQSSNLKNTERQKFFETLNKNNSSQENQNHPKLDSTQNKIKTSPKLDANKTVRPEVRKKKRDQSKRETFVKDSSTSHNNNNNISNASKHKIIVQKKCDKANNGSSKRTKKQCSTPEKLNTSLEKKSSGSSHSFTLINWLSKRTNSSTSSLPIDIFSEYENNGKVDEGQNRPNSPEKLKAETSIGKSNYKTKRKKKDKYPSVICSPKRTQASKLNSTANVTSTKPNKKLCIGGSSKRKKELSTDTSATDFIPTKRNKKSARSNIDASQETPTLSLKESPKYTTPNSSLGGSSVSINCKNKKDNDRTKGCSKLGGTISKKNLKNDSENSIHKGRTNKKHKSNTELHLKDNGEINNAVTKKKSRSKKTLALQTLDDFLNKSSEKYLKTKSNCETNESCVRDRKKLKATKSSDLFKKYGVAVPSVEEILKEQEDLALYKNQIEAFQDVDDKVFELPFSVKDFKNSQVVDENVLSCQHLSMQDIELAFKNNLDYISSIFSGKTYNDRHERFFSKDVGTYKFTVKDLNYNTSTIVFSFDQREHMIRLLKKEFDGSDKWTLYFFQVLLPELCLKIFMDTHSMQYDEAIKYLDTRPILDE